VRSSVTDRGARWTRRRRAAAAFGFGVGTSAVMLLAACSSSGSTASPSSPTSASSPSSSAAQGASASPAAAGGNTATATETEFRIALSKTTFHPGTYTFTAVNKGSLQHSLIIDGPGVNHAKTQGLLSPGQSESVTVTLQKGTYDIYCGVPGHKDQGMDVHITVS
jgi:uncharacterized cupredoxin-like copper-binding protein